MNTDNIAYLTVINWPDRLSEDKRIEALVGSAAMDPFQAKLACRRNLPGVMATIDADVRPHILNAMHKHGVLCIAPTHDEIESYPQAQIALGIQQFPDADPARFVVELNNGKHWTFRPDQVKLLVSGHIKSSTTTVDVDHNAPDSGGMNTDVRINRNTKVLDLLDLHIRVEDQLRLVRLIGPRTRIGIVGDTSRRSLLDDSRPIEMAQILMPDAQFDTEFHDFDPPGNIRRLAAKKGRKSGSLTMESWEFYSPWVGLIKQAMYGW
ncbi:hypothetical protein COB72_02925 [bacterium]|nr:MAG: hypothetical protein COB72_02925 [bacterium]